MIPKSLVLYAVLDPSGSWNAAASARWKRGNPASVSASAVSPAPDLDAGANAVALEHIKLENEGWEQDTTLTEPTER